MRFLEKAFAVSILLGVLITPITFIPLVNAQEGQVTLNPTDDTYCGSYYNWDSNFGGQPVLNVSRYEVGYYEIYDEIVGLNFNLFLHAKP